jgi:hypothetical protein
LLISLKAKSLNYDSSTQVTLIQPRSFT